MQAEITGSVYPEEVIVIGGHIDSWDVGQGAVDDASGAFVAWGALSAIRELNLRPKRTIRAVFWNGEENTGMYLCGRLDGKHWITMSCSPSLLSFARVFCIASLSS